MRVLYRSVQLTISIHTALFKKCFLQIYSRMHSKSCNHTTGVNNGLFRKHASKFSITISAVALRVSSVPMAAWGKSTTFSRPKSSSGTCGSCSNTSSTAAASLSSSNAETNSDSSTRAPLPMLMRKPFGPSALMISGSMIWYVSSFKGQKQPDFAVWSQFKKTCIWCLVFLLWNGNWWSNQMLQLSLQLPCLFFLSQWCLLIFQKSKRK